MLTLRATDNLGIDGVTISFLNPQQLPAVIEPEGKDMDVISWGNRVKPQVRKLLERYGAVLLRGFPINGSRHFEDVTKTLTSKQSVEYREKATPRSHVGGNVFTSTEYPNDRIIFPHNENSHCTTWPRYVAFYAELAPHTGGETPLVDCRKLYKDIPAPLRRRLQKEGFLYSRTHGLGLGLSWQEAYSVKSKQELEDYCADNRMDCQWKDDGVVNIRYRRWASLTHPDTRERVWFNHGVFYNVNSLEPDLKTAFLTCYDPNELPYNTFYKNGKFIEEDTINALVKLYSKYKVKFPYHTNDILLVDNLLVAHGREKYQGERKILVTMTEMDTYTNYPDAITIVDNG